MVFPPLSSSLFALFRSFYLFTSKAIQNTVKSPPSSPPRAWREDPPPSSPPRAWREGMWNFIQPYLHSIQEGLEVENGLVHQLVHFLQELGVGLFSLTTGV